MALKKCPACKNIVGTDSYCCPRCGIDFQAMRTRRIIFWLVVVGLAAWVAYKYVMPRWMS
jgi:predicted nucleic acid-binding Zn ribbon protein